MYISIDMGGTNTRVGSSKNLLAIHKTVKTKTLKTLDEQKISINQQIKTVSDGEKIDAICLGVPGTLDRTSEVFLKLPNYKVLEGKKFNELLFNDLQRVPLLAVNDANMAGYQEAVSGAGKGFGKVLYISIGTGVGGSLIHNKNINDVLSNQEPGHAVLFNDGLDFEDHCSGHAFTRIYGRTSHKEVPDEIWKTYTKDLERGLKFLQIKHSMDVIVLGGGFSVNNFEYFSKYLPSDLNVKLAQYGDLSGVFGGFALLEGLKTAV